ncbi:MAG: hypothetical protein ACFFDK_05950 [Promethearchaeota archaeon]
MIKNEQKNVDEMFSCYDNIRECISGLTEILNINFQENNIYRQMGIDNLKNLHDNVIDLLKHICSPREVRIRLREIEYDEKEAEKDFPFKLMM